MLSDVLKMLGEAVPENIALVRADSPYQIPKGFMSWDKLSILVGAALEFTNGRNPGAQDAATFLHNHRLSLWFLQRAPIYTMRLELLRAFQATDVVHDNTLMADLDPPLSTFMLLFPSNSIVTPEGYPLDFAVVHLADHDHPDRSTARRLGLEAQSLKVNPGAERNLHWSSIDGGEVVWFGGMDVDTDGNLLEPDGRQLGDTALTEADYAFTRGMRSVIIQTVLALTYRPDLLEAEPTPEPTRANRPGRARATPKVLRPRWLGNSTKKGPSLPKVVPGHHSSPQAHWRRGHWRRVSVGPRDQQGRKWVWITPTFVNG